MALVLRSLCKLHFQGHENKETNYITDNKKDQNNKDRWYIGEESHNLIHDYKTIVYDHKI